MLPPHCHQAMVQKSAVDADDVGQSTYLVHELESRPLGTRYIEGEAGGVIIRRCYISATEAGVWVVVVDIFCDVSLSCLIRQQAMTDETAGEREHAIQPVIQLECLPPLRTG